MTIGMRMQQARVRSGLTQEQAAEQLNVTRQTISNWENDKTVPDVAIAMQISRVYGISLDALVTETASVEVETVELSDDNCKVDIGVALFKFFFASWLICVLIFWVLKDLSGLAMLYAIVVYGIFFPACCGIIAFLAGLFECWPNKGFFFVLLCGVGQMLLPYMTFSLANTISSGNINPLDLQSFFMGFVVGAVCLVLGSLVNWISDYLSGFLENRKK